jgi:ornithine carbamoyltransferase
MRHFLSLLDLDAAELNDILSEAVRLKKELKLGNRPPLLASRVLGLVFEKQSLRTRASFEAAMAQLGGHSIFLSANDGAMGQRESVADFARALSSYTDIIALRTYKHTTVEEFALHSSVPVINGLSDLYHPCQALGDLLTIQEVFGGLSGRTLVFVGDGNNVARSIAVGCGLFGLRFILAAPDGYGFDDSFVQTFHEMAPKGELILNGEPSHAVGEADIIYTDVWTSMGQESEREERRVRFAPFQVNEKLMALAPSHARVMHCLPAVRGEEVSCTILDGDRSIAFQQAENRLHAQKALMLWLLRQ